MKTKYTILDLVRDMRGATKERLVELALAHPEYAEFSRSGFMDSIMDAMVHVGISDGALGDNMAGLDETINLAGAWRRACRAAETIDPEYLKKCQEANKKIADASIEWNEAVEEKDYEKLRKLGEKLHNFKIEKLGFTDVKCLRCGHEWYPRGRRPARCPGCGSARWDTPPSPSDPGPKRKKPAE